MSRRLVVDEDAEEELAAAYAWYERQREGLGNDLMRAVDAAVAAIGSTPSLAISHVSDELGARRVQVRRYPYSVVYIVTDDEVRIIAFAHGRRRPAYWRDRT